MFGLEYLVAPVPVGEFRERHWGRRALHIPGHAGKFEGLFGWDDVNHALNHSRRSYEGVRLLYDKNSLPNDALSSIDHWLSKGATLVINNVNQTDPVVDQFGSSLGADLNTHVNINSYMSCPNKQGFDNHFDRHDVFVVHLAGTKAWKVFEPTLKLPLHQQPSTREEPPDAEPYIECELEPGDVLYIPRGHWHNAVAITPSIHLTVGPEARTGSDFLRWLLEQLMNNDEFFRRDFPLIDATEFGGGDASGAFAQHMDEFRRRMHEVLDRESLNEAFVRYCMAANPVRRTYQLPHTWLLGEQTTPDTRFVVPRKQKALVHYDEESRYAVVEMRGKTLHFNNVPRDVVAALFSEVGKPFRGRDILEKDDTVEWTTLKDTLVQLYQHGVLLIAEAEQQ